MSNEVLGRNIYLLYNDGANDLIFAGTTGNTFERNIEAITALTKQDGGSPRYLGGTASGSISIEGLVTINEAGDDATQVDKDDIIDLVEAKALIDFVYGGTTSGDVVRKGKILLTSYSETTDSEGLATFSVSGEISGAITKETLT